MIRVKVEASISENGQAIGGDMVQACLKQCVADAVEGSFDEYPDYWRGRLRLKGELLYDDFAIRTTDTRVRFDVGLPDELFPVDQGGFQLLVNLLAGDMFPIEMMGCTWKDVQVLEVELPEDFTDQAYRSFREARAHKLRDVRARFSLAHDRPLLAFSFKPRVGLTYDETREITLEVLRAGFNLVELDARNLALRSARLEDWIALGIEAATVGSHGTAFSPNFSIPPAQLVEVAQQWTEQIAPHGPPVIKVDGGLDGLSGIQSLRQDAGATGRPIVTCYPILRNQLSSAIGADTWVDFLSRSGVDIIYPGGRPTFPNERRPVWGAHAQGLVRAARTYDRFVRRGWPMPTIAGGVHPGHLHACYELLGPEVAYFLGGAVALHPDGPARGAKLCVRVLDEAIVLARQAYEAGDSHADDLSAHLLEEVRRTNYPKTVLNYYSPKEVFGVEGATAYPPQTFYRRMP